MGTLNIENAPEQNPDNLENDPPNIEEKLINYLTLIIPATIVFLLLFFNEKRGVFAARFGAAIAEFFFYLIFLGFCEIVNRLFLYLTGNKKNYKRSKWHIPYIIFTVIFLWIHFR